VSWWRFVSFADKRGLTRAEIADHAMGWASKPQLGESATGLSVIDKSQG
jgi:hypothetical protein